MYWRTSSSSSIRSLSLRSCSLSDDPEIAREKPPPPAATADKCPERRPPPPPPVRSFDRRSNGGGRRSSSGSSSGMSADEIRQLWRCMLALQRRYGCYNSTRMDLAVGAGDDALDLMPNPFILDTLNDSVINLPDEGWEMLSRCLRHDDSA